MSQDNLVKMECGTCHRINYYTKKNKKILKNRILLKKYCKMDKQHTDHKETK
jgi:large subunit ribosomal protein L33